jgi:hypothetical protein
MYIDRLPSPAFRLVLIAAVACSSPQRDLGEIADGGEDRDPEALNSQSNCPRDGQREKLQAPRRAAFLSEFVGSWLGHAEDALGDVNVDGTLPIYRFPSGSTRILLEVYDSEQISGELTFGERSTSPSESSALLPGEGLVYPLEPILNSVDIARSGQHGGDSARVAFDGKLVFAFSLDEPPAGTGDRDEPRRASELHLRFAGDSLVGVFDGVSLLNERGFLTRPGSVRFRKVSSPFP